MPQSLDDAIAELKKAFPAGPARVEPVLSLIRERTKSLDVAFELLEPLGGCAVAQFFPPLSAQKAEEMLKAGAVFRALSLCDEIWLASWNAKPRTVIEVPWQGWQKTLTYAFIHVHLGHDHIMVFPFPPNRPDGNQLVICCLRSKPKLSGVRAEFGAHLGQPAGEHDGANQYTLAEISTLEKICREFEQDFLSKDPEGLKAELPGESINPLKIAADFTIGQVPSEVPLYIFAIITRFYGRLAPAKGGRWILPDEMKAEIRAVREAQLKKYASQPDTFPLSTKRYSNGRLLSGTGRGYRDGSYSLDLVEDVGQLEALERVIKSCRREKRLSRDNLFKVCLIIAEGERTLEKIAVRMNFKIDIGPGEESDPDLCLKRNRARNDLQALRARAMGILYGN